MLGTTVLVGRSRQIWSSQARKQEVITWYRSMFVNVETFIVTYGMNDLGRWKCFYFCDRSKHVWPNESLTRALRLLLEEEFQVYTLCFVEIKRLADKKNTKKNKSQTLSDKSLVTTVYICFDKFVHCDSVSQLFMSGDEKSQLLTFLMTLRHNGLWLFSCLLTLIHNGCIFVTRCK